jgi:hypothetical protein
MTDKDKPASGPRVFDVETNFQKAARRPGGVGRDEAVRTAIANIEQMKPAFAEWLDQEFAELLRLVPDRKVRDTNDPAWIEAVDRCSTRLLDGAATMGYPFISFVATNLHAVCEAIRDGADYRSEVMACHIDALFLARLPKYKNMRPEDMPELSEGLRQVLASATQKTGKGPAKT